MKIQNVSDIPSTWEVLTVRKKTTVKIRPCNGVETFKVSWQDTELVSDPDLDLIVIQPNDKEYPCKTDIFWETYEAIDEDEHFFNVPGVGGVVDRYDLTYIKKATTQLVVIPEGEEVEIVTLEGTLPVVTYPDYIAIGAKGELYANTKQFVEENLEIL